jgi:hypothetical protein
MAVSGTISTTVFNTRRVIDQSFRRCRLSAQQITPEMQDYAMDALYLTLSEIANLKAPSWCVERQVYPLYQGLAQAELDLGTVEVLNCNLRTLQELTGATVSLPNSYTVDFTGEQDGVGTVVTVGVKWLSAAVPLTLQVSDDNATWTTVGTQTTSAGAGLWTWTDVTPANAYAYFRFTSAGVINASQVYLGTLPQEIPMGVLNRDNFVNQSNKSFKGRPLSYWYKRDRLKPTINLWPAPNLAAEHSQLIVWRHRHIMDVGTLAQEIEVPQRWLEAIVALLASKMALETPAVDMNMIPLLEQKAATSYAQALAGDNSGASSFVQPNIGMYTR